VSRSADFLVVGAGIIGLSIARELKRRHPDQSVLVLEKEDRLGRHSSGRNSGVLHSGLYYAPGSLKARLCRQGAAELARFHEQHGLPLRRCGKLLVPTHPERAEAMTVLEERAWQNGVQVERLDEGELRRLEPETRSATGEALWVPETAVGTPAAVLPALLGEVEALGATLQRGAELRNVDVARRQAILSSGERLSFGLAINAAGLQADRVAHRFGVGTRYALLPFKGLYWRLDPASGIHLNHLVYPVPELGILYLGVHTTTASDGTVYLGPTAVPAWGRENYRGLAGIDPRELPRIAGQLISMGWRDTDGFRQQAWQEGRRCFKPWFFEAARQLLPRLRPEHLQPAAKVGLHPRLYDRERGRLVKDFVLEEGRHSLHILGATSPAWTSAFPFARHVCDWLAASSSPVSASPSPEPIEGLSA